MPPRCGEAGRASGHRSARRRRRSASPIRTRNPDYLRDWCSTGQAEPSDHWRAEMGRGIDAVPAAQVPWIVAGTGIGGAAGSSSPQRVAAVGRVNGREFLSAGVSGASGAVPVAARCVAARPLLADSNPPVASTLQTRNARRAGGRYDSRLDAEVAEPADAADLKSAGREPVGVRISPSVPRPACNGSLRAVPHRANAESVAARHGSGHGQDREPAP